MVTLITTIKNKNQLESLYRNLVCLEPDRKLGLDFLCLASQDLYLECRNKIPALFDGGECIVVSVPDPDFKCAKEYLTDKNKYVFLSSSDYVMSFGCVGKLYRDYLENRDAGFISGMALNFGNAFYWVKDVYGYPDFCGLREKELFNGLNPIDIASPRALMTKTSIFKDVYCSANVDGGFEYSFGIKLRRQGYQNYLDTRVELRQEVK